MGVPNRPVRKRPPPMRRGKRMGVLNRYPWDGGKRMGVLNRYPGLKRRRQAQQAQGCPEAGLWQGEKSYRSNGRILSATTVIGSSDLSPPRPKRKPTMPFGMSCTILPP